MIKKLNNKGYMLVEIVLASVIAFSVAYYLLNLTYKFKDKNMIVYESTELTNIKINITKNIMNDLEKYYSVEYQSATNNLVTLKAKDATTEYTIKIKTTVNGSTKTIEYGKCNASGNFITTDKSYYKKSIKKSYIELGNIEVKDNKTITIPLKSIYDDNNYDIKLFVYKLEPLIFLFSYTGGVQEFTVPRTGYYMIETWGAQGGSSLLDGGARNIPEAQPSAIEESCSLVETGGRCYGGKGAYVSGNIYLTAGEKLYVYVGGKGGDAQKSKISAGGYNGGGTGEYDHSDDEADGGGGGATDIRLKSGAWNDANSLNSRIMVAAGGGGASDVYSGLPGGDLVNSNKNIKKYERKSYTESSQNKGYAFGIGENGVVRRTNYPVAGGGGGYYGGKSVDNGTDFANMGAGGSSFIAGYAGSNAIVSTSTRSHSFNTKYTTEANASYNKYFINGYMKAGKNSGNGRATISFISETGPIRKTDTDTSNLNKVRYIKNCSSRYSSDEEVTDQKIRWNEIQAIKNGINVAKDKKIKAINKVIINTGCGATENPLYSNYCSTHSGLGGKRITVGTEMEKTIITDGDIGGINWTDAYTEENKPGETCIQLDLGQEYDLDEIVVWQSWAPNFQKITKISTSVSFNGSTWRDIETKEKYKETSLGKRYSAFK